MSVGQSKILKSLLLFFLLFNFAENICSQSFQFGKLTVEDGLSNNSVNCLIQDHFGFLWFGTDDGLDRYDGYDIKVYRNDIDDSSSLSDNIIWALFEDHSGFVWIGTKSGGLNRYNPITDKFEHWNPDSKNPKEISITCIYEDKNNFIWIGTYKNGLYKFDQTKNIFQHWQNYLDSTKVLSDNFITSIIEDNAGKLWIATYNGLNRFNTDNSQNPFTYFNKDSKEFTGLNANLIWYLDKSMIDPNSIWTGTIKGLAKFNPQKNSFTQYSLPENKGLQFGMSVSSMAEEVTETDTILWVGTFGGLNMINLSTGQTERFIKGKDSNSGILSNQVNEVIRDRSGVIWIATDNGLNFYSQKSGKFNFHVVGNSNQENLRKFMNKNTRAISQTPDGSIWIGTDDGLYDLKNVNSGTSINFMKELNQINVWSLSPGKFGDLWIGTYGDGLKELNLESNKIKSWKVDDSRYHVAAYNYIKTILQDNDGKVWIGFWGGGLARLDPVHKKTDYWRNELKNVKNLSYNDVWTLFKDRKGRIWVGTNGGGLDMYDKTRREKFFHWSVNKNKKNSLSSDNIYSICESVYGNHSPGQNILWIGTGNGLNKFEFTDDDLIGNEIESNVKITSYSVNDGLPDNSIESILEDENGNIWIGTSSGISFFDVKKNKFTNYNTSDGLKGDTFNSNSAYKTSDGLMIFGSNTGFNVFSPKKISQSSYSPTVLITNFQIFNKPVNISNNSPLKTSIYSSKEIHLSFSQNVFSFQFSALDFNSPNSIQYAYKMEGFDRDWINSGTRRFVTYTNLDPGKYEFFVKSTNSDEVWSNNVTKIAIIISPPFWATWWFRILMLLIFAGILYWLYRIRLKRILELERLRIKIASDLHDDIGSALTRISIESELLGTNTDQQERKTATQRISQMSREIITSMSDVVWSIDSRNDSVENLVNRMKDFAYSIFSAKNVRVIFETNNLNMQKKLKVDVRQNIYLIFKEAINNSAKYSTSDQIKVVLKNESGNFFMIVDNPKTIFSEQKLTGHGLRNMQMRAERMDGKIELIKDNGFKVIYTGKEL